jgi:hypothetical protein
MDGFCCTETRKSRLRDHPALPDGGEGVPQQGTGCLAGQALPPVPADQAVTQVRDGGVIGLVRAVRGREHHEPGELALLLRCRRRGAARAATRTERHPETQAIHLAGQGPSSARGTRRPLPPTALARPGSGALLDRNRAGSPGRDGGRPAAPAAGGLSAGQAEAPGHDRKPAPAAQPLAACRFAPAPGPQRPSHPATGISPGRRTRTRPILRPRNVVSLA